MVVLAGTSSGNLIVELHLNVSRPLGNFGNLVTESHHSSLIPLGKLLGNSFTKLQ